MAASGKGLPDVEQQLADLQRKYRIMEGNRRSYSEDSQKIILHQRQTIEKLKEDNQRLKGELALEAKSAIQAPTVSVQEKMSRLQDAADMYTRKIELENRKVKELTQTIELCEGKYLEMRKKMGGINAAKENNQQVSKQVKVLENRLDKALVKFNEALSHNKTLRDEIDNLRRERVVFDQIYKKLERELHEKKKEMANIIEISNIAYEARDQAQNEIAALRAQADKEQAAFEAEWRELGKLLEADKKMHDMMKSRKDHQYGEMTMEEEAKLRKKVLKGNWAIAKDKAAATQASDQVESYQEAFQKIQQATGISDIDELVTTFINAEDQNFSLFNYVNELNQEIEKLEENIAEINAEAERFKGQGVSTDSQRNVLIEELEERIKKTEERTEAYDQRFQTGMRIINALKAGISSIFNKIGCNTPVNRELVGDGGVTETNMGKYMSAIENRGNEILAIYYSYLSKQQAVNPPAEATEGAPVLSLLGTGPATPAGTTQINIDPPSTADDYQSDDDSEEEVDDRPLTRDELQAKTLRSLTKRGNTAGARRKKK